MSEMTIERAAVVLKETNKHNPVDVKKAIDVAVRELEKIVSHNEDFESLAEAFGCEE